MRSRRLNDRGSDRSSRPMAAWDNQPRPGGPVRSITASSFVGLIVFVALATGTIGTAQQAPAGTAPAPAQGARGRGPAPTDTLGAGPWDLPAGRGRIHVSVVTKGLDHPWGLAFLPDGGLLVTERPGRLRVIRNGVLDPTPIGPLPAMLATGLGGLLDVSLHPRFAQNRFVYMTYSKPGPGEGNATTAVMRATLGWRFDARRRQGHPRRRCVSRWTGIAARARTCQRQLRLAACVGPSRVPLCFARRSQLPAGITEPGVAHREDSSHPR